MCCVVVLWWWCSGVCGDGVCCAVLCGSVVVWKGVWCVWSCGGVVVLWCLCLMVWCGDGVVGKGVWCGGVVAFVWWCCDVAWWSDLVLW